jgi:hypothetical protein
MITMRYRVVYRVDGVEKETKLTITADTCGELTRKYLDSLKALSNTILISEVIEPKNEEKRSFFSRVAY